MRIHRSYYEEKSGGITIWERADGDPHSDGTVALVKKDGTPFELTLENLDAHLERQRKKGRFAKRVEHGWQSYTDCPRWGGTYFRRRVAEVSYHID